MPRTKKGTPPSYRLHKSTGQAVVTIAGRDVYLGEYGSKSSFQQYALVLLEHSGGHAVRKQQGEELGRALVEVLAAYWEYAKSYYVKNGKPTNELDAIRIVVRDLRLLFGDESITEFGPAKLKSVRQLWIDRGQARPTINKNQRRLTRIFRWAVSEELAPPSVYEVLRTVPGLKKGRCNAPEPAPIMPVPSDVVEQTLKWLPRVIQDMVRFQLLTGARPGEVCMLTPGSVDRSSEIWEYRVSGHKTEHHERSRTVFIGPAAQEILTPYLFRPEDRVCFSMAEALEQRRSSKTQQRTTPLSCGNRRGKRSDKDRKPARPKRQFHDEFDTGSYRKAIHAACDVAFPAPPPLACEEKESNAARIRRLSTQERKDLANWQALHRWHPNQLRHARATEVRAKFGLEAAQVILGHAAADVTQVYAERDAEKAREVARRIG